MLCRAARRAAHVVAICQFRFSAAIVTRLGLTRELLTTRQAIRVRFLSGDSTVQYSAARTVQVYMAGGYLYWPILPISLDGYPLMILDHIVAQDVRGHEILDIPWNPILDLDLRRDSAPAARRPCKDVVTTYLPTYYPYG